MNIIDIIILLIVLFGALMGFRSGIITQTVAFLGFIVVFLVAYFTKDIVAFYLCKWLPFLKIDIGNIKNLVTLNILFYEMLAFLIIFSLLMILFKYLMTFTVVFEAILKSTIILALPLKIGGAIVGAIQYLLVTMIILIILSSPIFNLKIISDAYVTKKAFGISKQLNLPLSDVVEVAETINKVEKINYRKHSTAELRILDAMLKNKLTNIKLVDMLVTEGKLKLDNIDTVLDKYRK